MGNPYPAQIADAGGGTVKVAGDLTFTDPANQPGGGMTVIGPYAVSHTDVDPVSSFDLGLLADGTIIWSVAVFVREVFSAADERIQVQLGLTSGFAQLVLTDVLVTGNPAHAGLASDTAVYQAANETFTAFGASFVGIAQHSAHLLAADIKGGNSTGTVDIYALVSAPA